VNVKGSWALRVSRAERFAEKSLPVALRLHGNGRIAECKDRVLLIASSDSEDVQ
jgi:hypothetical protein